MCVYPRRGARRRAHVVSPPIVRFITAAVVLRTRRQHSVWGAWRRLTHTSDWDVAVDAMFVQSHIN